MAQHIWRVQGGRAMLVCRNCNRVKQDHEKIEDTGSCSKS